jgi:hypothetical protein
MDGRRMDSREEPKKKSPKALGRTLVIGNGDSEREV